MTKKLNIPPNFKNLNELNDYKNKAIVHLVKKDDGRRIESYCNCDGFNMFTEKLDWVTCEICINKYNQL